MSFPISEFNRNYSKVFIRCLTAVYHSRLLIKYFTIGFWQKMVYEELAILYCIVIKQHFTHIHRHKERESERKESKIPSIGAPTKYALKRFV